MAPHSSTLAWKIPWTEEPGRLQSMGLLRVGHDWATSLSLFTLMHGRRKWQHTPVFLSGESQGRGSLVGCHLWGRTVGHDWSDLAAAAGAVGTFNLQQVRQSTGDNLNLWMGVGGGGKADILAVLSSYAVRSNSVPRSIVSQFRWIYRRTPSWYQNFA